MSLKHQDAGKSAHPINVGEARWSSGCRGHGRRENSASAVYGSDLLGEAILGRGLSG